MHKGGGKHSVRKRAETRGTKISPNGYSKSLAKKRSRYDASRKIPKKGSQLRMCGKWSFRKRSQEGTQEEKKKKDTTRRGKKLGKGEYKRPGGNGASEAA